MLSGAIDASYSLAARIMFTIITTTITVITTITINECISSIISSLMCYYSYAFVLVIRIIIISSIVIAIDASYSLATSSPATEY